MIWLVYKQAVTNEKTYMEKLYRRLMKLILEMSEIARVVMIGIGFATKNVAAVVEGGHGMIVVISFRSS